MIEMTPTPSMTDEQVEVWFAAAGLNVDVVDHCPAPTCLSRSVVVSLRSP